MPRYIDADEIYYHKNCGGCEGSNCEWCEDYVANKSDIDDIDTADVHEVRHGKWISDCIEPATTYFRCSLCGRIECLTNDYFGKPTTHAAQILPYCHCGAKMEQ